MARTELVICDICSGARRSMTMLWIVDAGPMHFCRKCEAGLRGVLRLLESFGLTIREMTDDEIAGPRPDPLSIYPPNQKGRLNEWLDRNNQTYSEGPTP